MEKFHDTQKTVCGPKSSSANPLLSAYGITFLIDKDKDKAGQKTKRDVSLLEQEGGYLTRYQGCIHNSYVQKRHVFLTCWKDTAKH